MTSQVKPELIGLVLAGGESRRLGEDKGQLRLHDRTQAEHSVALLKPYCRTVYLSVRREQAEQKPYKDQPSLPDDEAFSGPAAGLLTAWQRYPNNALLVLAVDMPLVDSELIDLLVQGRRIDAVATAYRHSGGIIEPLCTIWEPSAEPVLRSATGDRNSTSLRRFLESADVELLDAPALEKLVSVNTPEAVDAARRALKCT